LVSAPQKETHAPVDRRLTTASGGGGGVEAEGGILRFRLWYLERFAEKWLRFSDFEARPFKTSASPKSGILFSDREARQQTSAFRRR
jgi:hypothetical protein